MPVTWAAGTLIAVFPLGALKVTDIALASPQCEELPSEFQIRLSVHDVGANEASQYKWIESEKAGRDLGEQAIRDWVREHWNRFLRERWIEHLEGKTYWIELDHDDFGLLRKTFADPELLSEILSRLKSGEENLDVLQWALDGRLATDEVIEILEVLDINSRRIGFQYGSRILGPRHYHECLG